jgi:ATP-binding cassette subfamily C protein
MNFIKQYRVKLIIYILISVTIGAIGLAIPIIVGKLIDGAVYIKDVNLFVNYIVIFLLINIFNITISYFSSRIRVSVGTKSEHALCTYILEHFNMISLLELESDNDLYLSQRIKNDSNDIIYFCLNTIADSIFNVLGLLIAFALIIKINYLIALALAVVAILYIVGYKIFKNPVYETVEQAREQQLRYFSNINNYISRAKFIKLQEIQKRSFSTLSKSFSKLYKAFMSNHKASKLYNSFNIILSVTLKMMLYLIGGINIMNGNMTIGILFILSSYLDKVMSALIFFASFKENYQVSLASYARVIELIDKSCAISEEELHNGISCISLQNISFKYNEKYILNNFSQKFNKGNIYWVKGHEGSGKSTLLNLINGLYKEKYEGKICYDNKDINLLDMNEIRKDPSLLILDEPTLAMDMESKIEFYDYIQEVKKDKIIIIVSLDQMMDEVADYTVNLNVTRCSNIPLI